MKKVRISDICEVYDGPHATPTKTKFGPIYLGIKAITEDGFLDTMEFAHLSEEDYQVWTKRVTPKENDIVFSYEATLNRYALIPKDFYGCLGRRLAILRAKNDDLNIFWLYYYFQSPQWQTFISNHMISGSTVNRISIDDFPDYKINLPSRKEQDAIVAIINSVTNKISLNNKINAELESMAKTIYDYWFTQFDFPDENGRPYKSSGGKMVWNEELQREIPVGWEVGNLYDLADFVNGLACQNFRPKYNEQSLPVIKIKEMHDGFTNETEYVSNNIPEKIIVHTGDILFSWSATLEVQLWSGKTGGLNQHIFKIYPKKIFGKYYVYIQLKEYVINFQKIAESRKTTMGHITTDHLNQSRVTLPPKEVNSSFEVAVGPIYENIQRNNKENDQLTKLRYWLLPMLMNGQIEFKYGVI